MAAEVLAEVCTGRACFDVGGGEWDGNAWVAALVFGAWAICVLVTWVVILVDRYVFGYGREESSAPEDEVEPCRESR